MEMKYGEGMFLLCFFIYYCMRIYKSISFFMRKNVDIFLSVVWGRYCSGLVLIIGVGILILCLCMRYCVV